MDNKKKLVFGVLVAALLGVGAFQFIGGSQEPVAAAPTQVAKEAPKLVAQTSITVPPLGPRDPFAPARLEGGVIREATPEPAPSTGGAGQTKLPPIRDIFGGGGNIPVLPETGGGPGLEGQPTIQVTPTFSYVLVGVVMGDTPAAVFADASGNQRLITLGGSIDGDSKVVAIENGKVVVKFGKDMLTLSIGGTASEK